MPLFVTSTNQLRHGVFAIEKKPPALLSPTGTEAACTVGQFDWGPPNVVTLAASPKDLIDTIAPEGVSRSSSAYLGIINKGFPLLYFVRVMGSGAVTASAPLPNATPVTIITVAAKYAGTAANSFTATVADADDADSNHFNLTVSVTGASGTTSETYTNINVSGVGSDTNLVAPFANSLLIGTVTKNAAGRPVNGTVSFGSGTTPAVAASDYVGTQGTGDKGFAQMEGTSAIRQFFTDDPGNTIRAAVNAGMKSHAIYMGDRNAYVNGPSGQSLSAVQADVGNYRTDRVMYMDPWVYIFDEAGNKTLVPSASFAASVASQLSPSTPISWKDPEVRAMLRGIIALEFDRGQGAGTNTSKGISTFIKEDDGDFSIEADVNAEFPIDASVGYNTRRRMTDYIAITGVKGARPFVDSPNLPGNQQNLLNAFARLLDTLKANASDERDPNHTPHVRDWGFGDLTSVNSSSDIDDGNFTIPLNVKDSSGMYRIFININSGTGVQVTHA